MNRLIPVVVRALSLLAATSVTALIISAHAADPATLGARDVAASGVPVLARIESAGAPSA